jgi:N-acetylmuramoyl-L-alanine amidase
MIITIDPGHTKNTNAGINKRYNEGDAMYILAKYLEAYLSEYENTEVVLTRGESDNPTLAERGSIAVNSGSRVFISLHSNSVSDAESAAYVCGFYSVKLNDSKKLCQNLISAVTDVMKNGTDAWNRGALVKKNSTGSDYYGALRSSVAGNSRVEYSFIIEHGFHSNKKQCEFLLDNENLKKIAKAEADVLAEYFDIKRKSNFAVIREEIPADSNLNDYIVSGEYYFSGYHQKINNGPSTESENSAFILDVTTLTCYGVPYSLQRVYYIESGKEYVRGIYVKDGRFKEIDKGWRKK